MPRFRFDPPHVIAGRRDAAHKLRDPLYGGPTPWDDVPGKDKRWQQMRWALLYRNFVPTGYLNSDAMEAEAARYVALYGVAAREGPAADEALRVRFRKFLWDKVTEIRRHSPRPSHSPEAIRTKIGIGVVAAIKAEERLQRKRRYKKPPIVQP